MKPIIQKLGMFIAMLLASISATAYDFEVDGIYFNIISVPNETCAVTSPPEPLEGVVTIPSEVQYGGRTFIVKSIESSAFENNSNITEVELGHNLTQIGANAFANCTSINKVTVLCNNCNNAGNLENPAFNNCSGISALEFGSDVITVPKYLMMGAGSLNELKFGEGLLSIGDYAFYSHPELKRLLLPSSLEKFGKHSFENCTGLIDLLIPERVITIDDYAFAGCTSINSIRFPESLESICDASFMNCENIENINFSECNLKKIGSKAFYNCSNLGELNLSRYITDIGAYSFSNDIKLTSICIPESVVSIGSGAFKGCTSLVGVKCADCTATIGTQAFFGTSSLTEVELGTNIISIGEEAFIGSGIESITIPNSVSVISPNIFDTTLKNLIISDGDSPLLFEMNKRQGDYSTYYSYDGSTILTPHYITYYEGVLAPNITNLYLGRDINYGPDGFYNSSQVEISSPTPNSLKSLSLGTGFTKITKGFTCTTEISYYANYQDKKSGFKSYAKCTKIKESIMPDSLEDIRIINQTPPIPYTDWIQNKYSFPSNTRLFSDEQYKRIKIYVPSGTIDNFKRAEIWENFLFISETIECDILVTGIHLMTDTIDLNLSNTEGGKIDYSIVPDNAFNKQVIFQSENPEIAQVSSDGVVYPKAQGRTRIRLMTCDGSEISEYINISVKEESGVSNVLADSNIGIDVENGRLYIRGKVDANIVFVYNVQGQLVISTKDNEIELGNKGIYFIKIGPISKKIIL